MDPAISQLTAESISYEINDKLILTDLSLSIKSGNVLLIEGGNGCGKTTLLCLLCGLIQPNHGTVRWNGMDIAKDRIEFNRQLCYIGHDAGVQPRLTPLENIRFLAMLSGLATKEDPGEAITWAGLNPHKNSPSRQLSYGQQRRIALARLFMETSRLWILDEPFSGIDKTMITALQDQFKAHVNQGGLLVITSHQHIELDELNTTHIHLR